MAIVTIANSAKLNAMSRHMWQQLRSVFNSISGNKDAGCVLISGAPCGDVKAFSAGGDISEYPSFRFNEASLRDFHEIDVWGGLQAMLACDVPIVAQIDGACMGAGVEMASCCDIRIAGASAKFGAPIAKLGFPMAPKEAEVVVRAVGELTAREMLLEAAVLDAPTMLQRGFLNRVVADADVADAAMQSVNRILALAPNAARLHGSIGNINICHHPVQKAALQHRWGIQNGGLQQHFTRCQLANCVFDQCRFFGSHRKTQLRNRRAEF